MKTLLKLSILFIIPLSCHWNNITLSKKLEKEVKFKGDAYFHYQDYSKFSRELKELYDFNIELIGREKVEAEGAEVIENYLKKWSYGYYKELFVSKKFYEKIDTYFSEKDVKRGLKREYTRLQKDLLPKLIRLNLENNIKYNSLKSNSDFYSIYMYIGWIFAYKRLFGDLRKYYEDFDILFVKEALAKTTKILIYHVPALYKDLAYLFENRDDYFKQD